MKLHCFCYRKNRFENAFIYLCQRNCFCYRENGFENAFISVKKIASEIDVEPKFREK